MSSSNLPNKLRDIPVFIGNPWVRVIDLLDDVVIVEPVTAEIWFAKVNHPEIVVTPVVNGQTITVTLTPSQIALLPSRNASINIKFDDQYVFQQKLTPTYEAAIPEDIVEEYDTPGLGIFRVSYYSDITSAAIASQKMLEAAEYAAQAEIFKSQAKVYADEAQQAKLEANGNFEYKGEYKPATNSPTLTSDATVGSNWIPEVSGKPQRYSVSTPGALLFDIDGLSTGQTLPAGYLTEGPNGLWIWQNDDSAALQKLEKYDDTFSISDDSIFAISSKDNGSVALMITSDGTTHAGDVEVKSISIAGEALNPADLALSSDLAPIANSYKIDLSDGSFSIRDENGWQGALLDQDGIFNAYGFKSKQVDSENLLTNSLAVSGGYKIFEVEHLDGVCQVDANGWIGEYIISSEKLHQHGFNADMLMWITYGQSLSVGQGGTPIIHTATEPFVWTFNKGPFVYFYHAASDPTIYDSIRLATELVVETPCNAFGRMVKQAINAEVATIDGTSFVCDQLVTAPGQGGYSLAQLSKGGAAYTRFMLNVTKGRDLSHAAGKTFAVPCVFWMQGEAETSGKMPSWQYKNGLRKLKADITDDIQAANSQINDPFFLLYQGSAFNAQDPSSPYYGISEAMLDLALNENGFFLGPVMYPYEYSDGIHLLNGAEYAKVGALAGYIAMQIEIKGVDWKPIHVKSTRIENGVLDVVFHVPYGKLAFDTTLVTNPGNYGFRLFDETNVEQTITSVSIVRPNTVRIVPASSPSSGWKLTYARNGTPGSTGRTAGPRGNLRDTQGDDIIYKPGDLNYRLYNWCPHFNYIIK